MVGGAPSKQERPQPYAPSYPPGDPHSDDTWACPTAESNTGIFRNIHDQ